ncbi:hypothetical protein Poli38472_010382 [Pythium oligandrum]|uniref:Uncharacterized protein n=1 Tax=Pythium oligandrum TaxID=41045 RepID=A0A8K1F9R4_PYTOL|nr:hypothetical protein Poli38472_010382 [Pythium oligandrum]|eukprot:TMW55500.1 hypothetical protein Poli38472_010382 [Pythium oligandrum]
MTATTMSAQSPRRIKIYFQDESLRQRCQANAQQLLSAAQAPATSNSALLAKKALKYRNVLDRMTGVDVTSPDFDASKFLGVDWCKTSNLQAHRMRQN